MTAADRLRALTASPTELLGPPEGVEYVVTLSPAVALAIANLIEAAGVLSEAVADLALARGPVVSGPYALMDAETAHRKAVKALRAALAHLEELLP